MPDPLDLNRRIVPLEGGRNFRDLGGYAVSGGGRVRWERVFRSGSLAGLTQADWDNLRGRGIRALCDLRTTHERERDPFKWRDEAGLAYYARDYLSSFGDLRRLMQAGLPSGAAAREAMLTGYRQLPFDQAPAYRRLFAHLKAGETPLIFNCSAGKDRAGTAAALLLSALGASREVVVEDFVLTDRVGNLRGVMLPQASPDSMLGKQPPEVAEAILKADPDYIAAALGAVENQHGSVAAYLRDTLDVSEKELAAIQDHLLE